MRTPRVFISMGTPYRDEQETFRANLAALLRDRCGVDPRIIGVNEYPAGSPVHKIRDVMRTCDGVIVVAYERKLLTAGLERRGGTAERALPEQTYTTPWNHIESAMAFTLNLPLYIICEEGLCEEGLIESKVDWFVNHMELSPLALSAPRVADSIRSWVNDRVLPHSKKPKALLTLMTKLRLSEMTGEEWTAALAMLAAAFGLGVGAAKLIPSMVH